MTYTTSFNCKMNATSLSSAARGRSRSRTSRGSQRKRSMVSYSRSLSSVSRRTGLTNVQRGWPYNRLQSTYFDPFPTQMSAILRYSDQIVLDADTATPARHQFRCTSIFDPDYTSTGHQPFGHDQYGQLYNHYIVDKAIITVRNASTGVNCILGCSLIPIASAEFNNNTCRERKGTTFMTLPNEGSMKVLQSTYNKNSVYTVAQDSDLTAQMGFNPAENYFWDIWLATNGAANPPACALTVDITYFVTFSEPKQLGGS